METIIILYASIHHPLVMFFNSITDSLDTICPSSKFIIVDGDYNFVFQNPYDNIAVSLEQFFCRYGMVADIHGITRSSYGPTNSQLDNILSNIPDVDILSEIFVRPLWPN